MPDLLTIRRIRWGRVLLALWAAAIGRPVIAVDGARPEPWRVLILMGFDSALPALRQHDEAFRGALQSAAPDGVTIFTETLDTARFDYAALAPEYLALTRKKYAAQPIDLVVGVSDGAVAFLQDHHACLWPGAPVLYTALASLRADGSTGMAERISAARDGDAEVRAAAADSLDAAPAAQRLYALGPLLRDPVRGVRSAAARGLSSLPAAQIDAALRPAFDAALAEYIAAQSVSLDMPGARLNLAVVHQNTGRPDLAEAHYLAALKIDPDFTPARADLSQLYNQTGRNAEAERVLTDGLKRQPTIGELQYSLGLLLAEEQRLPEAAQALGRAAQLLPERARVHYNLGLALQQLGRRQPAEQALLRAQQLAPQDATTVYALAVFYAQGGQRTLTLQWAERLQALSPDDPGVRQFIERLRHAG